MKPRGWTDEERERLRCMWNSDVPTPIMSRLLDRTPSAITTQAALLRNAGEPIEWRHAAGRAR